MAELEFTAGCSSTASQIGKNNAAHVVHNITSNFNGTDGAGTIYNVNVSVTKQDGDANVGDLIDWTAQYRITIEKIVD